MLLQEAHSFRHVQPHLAALRVVHQHRVHQHRFHGGGLAAAARPPERELEDVDPERGASLGLTAQQEKSQMGRVNPGLRWEIYGVELSRLTGIRRDLSEEVVVSVARITCTPDQHNVINISTYGQHYLFTVREEVLHPPLSV